MQLGMTTGPQNAGVQARKNTCPPEVASWSVRHWYNLLMDLEQDSLLPPAGRNIVPLNRQIPD